MRMLIIRAPVTLLGYNTYRHNGGSQMAGIVTPQGTITKIHPINSNKGIEAFPFLDQVEADLLPAMIFNRRMWVELKNHIQPEYWRKEDRATIFKIFKVFFDKYHSFPTEMQCLDIATRKNYPDTTIEEINNVYRRIEDGISGDEHSYLYDETKLFIKNNKIKVALLDSVDKLEAGDFMGIEGVMKDAVNWDPDVSLGIDITDVENRFELLQELSKNVIPSPWKVLNQTLAGGFYGKELTIFAASSSVGKSIALDNIAFHAWEKGYNVVMITLELSEVRKAQRIDAAALRIPVGQVINVKDDVIKFYENKKSGGKLFIKDFPTGKASLKHVMNYLYQLELYKGLKMKGNGKEGLNILLIDALDNVAPEGKRSGDAYTDQGTVADNMRATAQELDIPVITATQLNRSNLEVGIDQLTEGHLADSWKKMGTADTLIGMANTIEERAAGRINFKTLKNRNGQKDVIFPLNIIYEQLRIADIQKK